MKSQERHLVKDSISFYSNLASRERILSREEEYDLGKRINDAYAQVFCLVLGTPIGLKQLETVCQKLEAVDRSKEKSYYRHNNKSYVVFPEEIDQYIWVKSYYEHNPWKIEEKRGRVITTHAENLSEILAGKNKNHLQEWFIDPVEERLKQYQEEIWAKYNLLARPDQDQIKADRNTFINANLRLVMNVAKKHLNRGVDYLELISAGNEGLIHSVGMFDYTRDTKFSTLATYQIEAYIRKKIRGDRVIRIPNNAIDLIGKIEKTSTAFKEKSGRSPSPQELAGLLEKSEETIKRALQQSMRPLSLDEEHNGEGDDGYTLYEFVEDHSIPSPLEKVTAESDGALVNRLIDRLEPREQQIMRMRFGIGYDQSYTLEEVGEKFGFTREWIRQLEARSLEKLRGLVNLPKLPPKPATQEDDTDILHISKYGSYRFRIFRNKERHLQRFLEVQMEDNPCLTHYVNTVRRMERLIGREIDQKFRDIWFDFSEMVGEIINSPMGYRLLYEAKDRLKEDKSALRKKEADKYQNLLLAVDGQGNKDIQDLPQGYDFEKIFASVLGEGGVTPSYAKKIFPFVHSLKRDIFEKEVLAKVIPELKGSTNTTEMLRRIEILQRSISQNERKISEGYQKPSLRRAVMIARESETDLEECIQAGNIGLNKVIKRHTLFWRYSFSIRAFQGCNEEIYAKVFREKKVAMRDWCDYLLLLKTNATINELVRVENIVPSTELMIERMNLRRDDSESLRPIWQEDFEVGLEVLEDENLWTDEGGLREYSGLVNAIEEPSPRTNQPIEALVDSLEPRKRKIMRMRFGIGYDRTYTLEEVGQEFKLTRERIRQLEAKGLEKLRAMLKVD